MILILMMTHLMAQEILIQGPNSTDFLFEKHLLENPRSQSFMQHLTEGNRESEDELVEQFKKAQFEFLKGSLPEAQRLFEKIGDLEHQSFWSKESIKIIHYSLLRAAQLSESQSDQFLERALLFDPDLEINKNLFPPPLMARYEKLKETKSVEIWPLPNKSQQFKTILINGHIPFENSQFIKYRKGKVRIDFLSNKFQPISITTSLGDLKEIHLNPIPLATGSCDKPKISIEQDGNRQFRVHDSDCLSPTTLASSDAMVFNKSPQGERKSSSFLKNRWFWVGLGVVAAGAAIHFSNQQNNGTADSNHPRSQEFSNGQ